MNEKDIPYGFTIVPEDISFAARGTAFDVSEPGYQEQWDAWATDLMRTRLFLIGTPIAPDRCGRVHLAYMPVALPLLEGEPAEALSPQPLTVTLNLN